MASGRILIVDGNVDTVKALHTLLCNQGFAVTCASEGQQALDLLAQGRPDLILMDIWLPGMDGVETLQAVKMSFPDVQVIMMSDHGNIETAVTVIQQGAFDYLEKTASPSKLLSVVSRALRHRCVEPSTCSHPTPPPKPSELIGHTTQITALREQIKRRQTDDRPLLIQGETGCEKTLIAHLVHNGSLRRGESFVVCYCSGQSEQALTRLLFGATEDVERGAHAPMKGYFELANGGTLYLDAIDSLSRELQHKLLHALLTRRLLRLGGNVPIPFNVRLIASCTPPLDQLYAQQILLPDLAAQFQPPYPIIPPLRARVSDLPSLIHHFLQTFAVQYDAAPKHIHDDAMAALLSYRWPGNDDELKHVMRHLVTAVSTGCIARRDLPISDHHEVALSPPCSISTKNHTPPSLQRTLRHSTVLYGQGLQSGLKTGMILSPLPPNSGIIFNNITTGERVPATIEHVESTTFSTNLRKGQFTARTIEHLLSVLHAYRISNLLIKITDEVPIMDGSATDFCQLIEKTGIQEQQEAVEEFLINRCYHIGMVRPDTKFLLVEPYDGFRITYRLNYPRPLGVQELTYEHINAASYRREIASARTFSFVSDVEKMHAVGLLAGGRLNNAILLDGEKIVNSTQLRFPEECARHKVLDLMGDMYLLGKPLRGHIRANMTGHTENIALVQKLHDVMHNGH
ncbi:MAG: UDP-3-O-acyl-N-acetylglucosamine deacetylase [Candidatus Tectomicrobia bacterium]